MDERDYVRKKVERLESVPDELISGVNKVQSSLADDLVRLMDQLDTVDGKIVLNQKNLALIETISARVNDILFEGRYVDSVKGFITQFPTQADLTNDYFQKAFGNLFDKQEKELFEKLLKQSQKNALSMLGQEAVSAQFIKPMRDILSQSVSTGASFGETVQTLTNFITGTPDMDGKLIRYVKTVAYDGFAQADRSYTEAVSVAIGVEFYRYLGGLLSDSREFCQQRNGNYYHKKEIEAWGQLKDWQGRNPNTNSSTIFTLAGGYNCKHSILPVSTTSVPKDVIERNIKKGFYDPKKK